MLLEGFLVDFVELAAKILGRGLRSMYFCLFVAGSGLLMLQSLVFLELMK